ncbi:MAG: hypothetical protein IJT11_00240, partial [Bacteroidaceae bacterium]|nr:hypothetical protein [Bacteroidaceae bacterium]
SVLFPDSNDITAFFIRFVARFLPGNSLLHRDSAIAASRQSNCCIALQQSTLQDIFGKKTNETRR